MDLLIIILAGGDVGIVSEDSHNGSVESVH